jgi:hypothetical protein
MADEKDDEKTKRRPDDLNDKMKEFKQRLAELKASRKKK